MVVSDFFVFNTGTVKYFFLIVQNNDCGIVNILVDAAFYLAILFVEYAIDSGLFWGPLVWKWESREVKRRRRRRRRRRGWSKIRQI